MIDLGFRLKFGSNLISLQAKIFEILVCFKETFFEVWVGSFHHALLNQSVQIVGHALRHDDLGLSCRKVFGYLFVRLTLAVRQRRKDIGYCLNGQEVFLQALNNQVVEIHHRYASASAAFHTCSHFV
ncbi:hypothetical protein [Puniceibacterium sediminis]|uniref:hypothetical protein n=1 Tax=Puniceibacterium sediminis TaxID=1608407 RepID=UPI000B77D25A|nr:hypothetical protein [Puniceibacterium sediminis]